jgi:hypothetical protein
MRARSFVPRGLFPLALLALTACHAEEPPPVAAPAASAAPSATLPPPVLPEASAAAGVDAAPSVLAPPVLAKFVTVTQAGAKVPVASACDVVFVAVAKGAVTVAGQSLRVGDALMVSSPRDLEVKGTGLVAVVTRVHDCQGPDAGAPALHVARAGDTKDLSWAGGAMHAHLDFEKDLSPDVYVGRLEGTAPVAEHDHGPSWEVLCAVEASGTFTVDGVPTHLVGPAIVAVPPGRKHSWQPDPGSKLVAVQVYAPPGPEQRFTTLAAAH